MEKFSNEENAAKYGSKQGDVIARHYRANAVAALYFCIISIDKYATRYNSDSAKSKLESDVMKMADYSERAKEMLYKLHEKGAKNVIEAINSMYEIKYAIEFRTFEVIPNLCIKASEKVDGIRISAIV